MSLSGDGHDLLSVIVNAAPLYNRDRAFIGCLVTLYDITDRKAAQEVLKRDNRTLERLVNERTRELLEAHTALTHAKRMSDIGRLSSTIAHEMRNPLAAIRMAAYNIQRKAKNSLLEKHLETINRKIIESDLIIHNLLNFSRIKTVNIEKFDICALLRDCLETVSAKYAGWDIELKEEIDCREGDTVQADQSQIRMLFSNILDNAYQALHGKAGTITVTVGKHMNRGWRISVADTGEGIDEKKLEKIFEPFYTTRSKGTGLGLAVCREIAEMHGGSIEVQSSKGKGSVFTVTIPFVRKPRVLPSGKLPAPPPLFS